LASLYEFPQIEPILNALKPVLHMGYVTSHAVHVSLHAIHLTTQGDYVVAMFSLPMLQRRDVSLHAFEKFVHRFIRALDHAKAPTSTKG
jgi:hypothetical protein